MSLNPLHKPTLPSQHTCTLYSYSPKNPSSVSLCAVCLRLKINFMTVVKDKQLNGGMIQMIFYSLLLKGESW